MEPVLPGLHQVILATAGRRRSARRRRVVVVAALVTLAVAGAAFAANQFLGEVDEGRIGTTRYRITASSRGDLICLRVVWAKARPAVRCDLGAGPSRPFGPVMRTVSPKGDAQLLVGLVRGDVEQVRSLIDGRVVKTDRRAGVPGRVFSISGRFRRVSVEALSAAGASVGRIGDQSLGRQPANHEEARAQGDPAAFAPTASAPPLHLHGRLITDREATSRHLHCSSDTGQCLTKMEVHQLCAGRGHEHIRRLFCRGRTRPGG